MLVGTSYFVSERHAQLYYFRQGMGYGNTDITRMIQEGEIHIGKPDIKPGQRLKTVDSGTRYAIED